MTTSAPGSSPRTTDRHEATIAAALAGMVVVIVGYASGLGTTTTESAAALQQPLAEPTRQVTPSATATPTPTQTPAPTPSPSVRPPDSGAQLPGLAAGSAQGPADQPPVAHDLVDNSGGGRGPGSGGPASPAPKPKPTPTPTPPAPKPTATATATSPVPNPTTTPAAPPPAPADWSSSLLAQLPIVGPGLAGTTSGLLGVIGGIPLLSALGGQAGETAP